MPWLARLLNQSPRLAAVVQNSLPSLAIITFNGVLPFLLECESRFIGAMGEADEKGCPITKDSSPEAPPSIP